VELYDPIVYLTAAKVAPVQRHICGINTGAMLGRIYFIRESTSPISHCVVCSSIYVF